MADAQSTAPAQGTSRATLGLTGLTINAMALIAPGAFLWLTYQIQSLYGAPMAGSAMWFGIVAALLLCLATAVSYAELSKLYPGAGSSYFFAEQAFLNKTQAFKFARLAKFITGWASHLYYWVYPGCMVGVTAIISGYLLNQFFPNTFSGTFNSPLFMILFCIVFALGVAYIAFRGVTGTTTVNMVINIVQITALLVFSIIAIAYRVNHPEGRARPAARQRHAGRLRGRARAGDGERQTQARLQRPARAAKQDGRRRQPGARDEGRQAGAVLAHLRRRSGHGHGALRRRPPQGSHAALQVPPDRGLGHRAAQLLLHLHPGLHRDPDPRRVRVGDVDGRRGEERQARHPARGAAVARDPGRRLLPVRVLRGQLLPQSRLQPGRRRRIGRARSAT